jgi:hypothetical protein
MADELPQPIETPEPPTFRIEKRRVFFAAGIVLLLLLGAGAYVLVRPKPSANQNPEVAVSATPSPSPSPSSSPTPAETLEPTLTPQASPTDLPTPTPSPTATPQVYRQLTLSINEVTVAATKQTPSITATSPDGQPFAELSTGRSDGINLFEDGSLSPVQGFSNPRAFFIDLSGGVQPGDYQLKLQSIKPSADGTLYTASLLLHVVAAPTPTPTSTP